MRTRSFQALAVRTTSRGAVGATLHSCGRSAQNSTQPIGALVVSPTEMNSASPAAAGAAVSADANQPMASIPLGYLFIGDPFPRHVGVTFPTNDLKCR